MTELINQFYQNYKCLEKIGVGTYGKVYRVLEIASKKHYAAKRMIISNDISYCIYNELIASHTFNHPNIIKVFDICYQQEEDAYFCYIIMEECDTSLHKLLIKDKEKIPREQRLSFLRQIIDALLYLRKKGYAHNDLSLGNILIKGNEIRIIDFGFMYQLSVKQKKYHRITRPFQPPELEMGDSQYCRSDKIDTWSLGMVFYAMCYNEELISWISRRVYCLDLITKIAKPSHQLLHRYQLDHKYMKLHRELVLDQPYEKIYINNKTMNFCLDQLIARQKKKYPRKNNLCQKNNENKFIKKLLNWNSLTRPDIVRVNQLFCQIFHQDFSVRIPKTNRLIEFSLKELQPSVKKCLILFEQKQKNFFSVHLINIIMQRNFNNIIKAIYLASTCYFSSVENDDVDLLNKVNYWNRCYENKNLVEKIENSFVRYYSFAQVISHHHNYLDTDFSLEQSSDRTELADIQFSFLSLLSGRMRYIDAWDLFCSYKINKIYEPRFKFLYYLFLSSPLIANINNKTILSAIMILILAYDYYDVDIIVKHNLLKVKNLVRFNDGVWKIIPHTLVLRKKMKQPCLITSEYQIGKISPSTFVIAYYLIWIIKKIPQNQINNCSKWFGAGKKFTKYIQHLG